MTFRKYPSSMIFPRHSLPEIILKCCCCGQKSLHHSPSIFEREKNESLDWSQTPSTHPLPWPWPASQSSTWWPTPWTEPALLAGSWRCRERGGGERSSWWGGVGGGGWVSSKRRGWARTSLARWSSASTSAKWHPTCLVPSVQRRIRPSYEKRIWLCLGQRESRAAQRPSGGQWKMR